MVYTLKRIQDSFFFKGRFYNSHTMTDDIVREAIKKDPSLSQLFTLTKKEYDTKKNKSKDKGAKLEKPKIEKRDSNNEP